MLENKAAPNDIEFTGIDIRLLVEKDTNGTEMQNRDRKTSFVTLPLNAKICESSSISPVCNQ